MCPGTWQALTNSLRIQYLRVCVSFSKLSNALRRPFLQTRRMTRRARQIRETPTRGRWSLSWSLSRRRSAQKQSTVYCARNMGACTALTIQHTVVSMRRTVLERRPLDVTSHVDHPKRRNMHSLAHSIRQACKA